jgi:hypothetical protein
MVAGWATRVRRSGWRVIGSIRRGLGNAGSERETLLLVGKTVLAATVAWLVADQVLHAPSATFAPFSALLVVQVTIARSVYQSVRYASAVVVGVVLTGGMLAVFGVTIWTFAGLLLVALGIGRWPKLGSQGSQVAVAALFAYSALAAATGLQESLTQLVSIAGLVVMGCMIGVLTNILIVPPLRYRSAQYGVSVLSQSLCDLLSDIDHGLRHGLPDADDTDEWRRRADALPGAVAQTRNTVEHTAEAMRFNPRRLMMHGSSSFDGYRAIINALQRASEQLCSITKGLNYAAQQNRSSGVRHEDFLRDYGCLLDAVADVARILGNLHTTEDLRNENHLEDRIDRARERYNTLVENVEIEELDPPRQWPIYSALHTDGHRIIQEFIQAQQELSRIIDAELPDDAGIGPKAGDSAN